MAENRSRVVPDENIELAQMTPDLQVATDEAPENEEEEEPVVYPKHSLAILETIKKAQIQNGIRQNDHLRYRQYCSRRLRRLRRSLKMTHGKKQIRRVKLEPNPKDPKSLLLPLTLAERCWAQSMFLKEDASQDEMRVRFHVQRRLNKAQIYSEILLKMCQTTADERTIIEAEAYHNWIGGSGALEKGAWKDALRHFELSRTVYDKFGRVGADAEQAPLFTQRVEEIDPIIRFCRYNLSSENDSSELMAMEADTAASALLKGKLDTALEESLKRQTETMESVVWRGARVALKNDKVRMCVVEAQSAHKKLAEQTSHSEKMATFDKLFMVLNDALAHLRTDAMALLKDQAAEHHGREAELDKIKAYITHQLLIHTVSRNRALIDDLRHRMHIQTTTVNLSKNKYATGKPVAPEDIATMFEHLIENMQEFKALPGFEDDDEEKQVVEFATTVYKGMRCYFMALSYNNSEKRSEAVALFNRAGEYVPQAHDLLPADASGIDQFVDVKLVEWLEKAARGGAHIPRAEALLKTHQVDNDMANLALSDKGEVVSEQLERFAKMTSEAPQLVHFPPSLSPIPVKPVLFDLAYDSLEFPNLETRKTKPKGFLGGFFS